MFFGLFVFSLYTYNNNTNILIIVGAHLTKQNKGYLQKLGIYPFKITHFLTRPVLAHNLIDSTQLNPTRPYAMMLAPQNPQNIM